MTEDGLDATDIIILKAGSLAIERYLLPLWCFKRRHDLAKQINALLEPIRE